MKYPEALLLLQLFFFSQFASAQVGDDINKYFYMIMASSSEEERRAYNDSIKASLLDYMDAAENIFAADIPGLNYLGQISSSDSLIKIFTWNIPIPGANNLYNCILYSGSHNKSFYLKGERGLQGLDPDEVLKAGDWYGSLYYDIQPFYHEGDTAYILLGFDPDNLNGNSKVVDILHFDKEGEPLFGKKVFNEGPSDPARMIFTYSPLATMMLRFSGDRSRLVFDHLSPGSEQFEGMYKYYGPDFSYDALDIKDGKLVLVEDVDLRNNN